MLDVSGPSTNCLSLDQSAPMALARQVANVTFASHVKIYSGVTMGLPLGRIGCAGVSLGVPSLFLPPAWCVSSSGRIPHPVSADGVLQVVRCGVIWHDHPGRREALRALPDSYCFDKAAALISRTSFLEARRSVTRLTIALLARLFQLKLY